MPLIPPRLSPFSISRSLPPAPTDPPPPHLIHTLHHQEKNSIISLAADVHHVFCGSQTADIYVWDRATFRVKTTLHGHTGSVLALELAREKEWLFSSSSDSTVRIWSTRSLTPICILTPHLDSSSGDIFSLSYSPALSTLYLGCQNTSLQWYDFSRTKPKSSLRSITTTQKGKQGSHPNEPHGSGAEAEELDFEDTETNGLEMSLDRKKWHRFFDNMPRLGGRPVDAPTPSSSGPSGSSTPFSGPQPRVLQVSPQNIIHAAHYGYVYCMALYPSPLEGALAAEVYSDVQEEEGTLLFTGSGDETVKVWKCEPIGPSLMHTFECHQGGVHSLVVRDRTLYAGCQDGCVTVWDLETKSLVRLILAQENSDVLSLSMIDTDLYACSANGWVQRWNSQFICTASWCGHAGIVLSSIVTRSSSTYATGINASEGWCLITGANDNDVKIWDIHLPKRPSSPGKECLGDTASSHDPLIRNLSKFVSFPSVSNCVSRHEDCRQAAIWLKRCFSQLGADATMLATGDGVNPLVLATFKGVPSDAPRQRVLFYGHYDVIAAPSSAWSTPPFMLTGINGYLYGRGVTDNKGPILAAAHAVSDMLIGRSLACDVIFLVEGEEEAGSVGFAETVRRHKDLIGDVDALLVSNSYWIGEETPCITFGLRGVVHATIDVSSGRPDLHSGVEGGSVVEPMTDMIKLLARLSEGPKILLPGFYDQVRQQTTDEQILYRLLAEITKKPASSLSSRWREPSLSLHGIETSGPGNATVIPAQVIARVSIRIVPDQDLEEIARTLVEYLKTCFGELQSPNTLDVHIDRMADWWLGDLDGEYFKALEHAIQEEWDVQPLRIREGGSIPSIPFLEKEFGCPGLHLPMGQSTDQAHLANERISLINLHKGKSVVERFLQSVSHMHSNRSLNLV